MKTHTLTRQEKNRLRTDQTSVSERIAAEAYGYSVAGASNFDAARDSGAVMESKSTLSRLSNGRRGRFRLWKKQHERLTRKDREGSATYVFILFDVSERPPVAYMKAKKPAKIGRIVASEGGFNKSGHHQGRQKKLPWTAIFDARKHG